jgi:hypothetical protein
LDWINCINSTVQGNFESEIFNKSSCNYSFVPHELKNNSLVPIRTCGSESICNFCYHWKNTNDSIEVTFQLSSLSLFEMTLVSSEKDCKTSIQQQQTSFFSDDDQTITLSWRNQTLTPTGNYWIRVQQKTNNNNNSTTLSSTSWLKVSSVLHSIEPSKCEAKLSNSWVWAGKQFTVNCVLKDQWENMVTSVNETVWIQLDNQTQPDSKTVTSPQSFVGLNTQLIGWKLYTMNTIEIVVTNSSNPHQLTQVISKFFSDIFLFFLVLIVFFFF